MLTRLASNASGNQIVVGPRNRRGLGRISCSVLPSNRFVSRNESEEGDGIPMGNATPANERQARELAPLLKATLTRRPNLWTTSRRNTAKA
jgi:hypothetical protein